VRGLKEDKELTLSAIIGLTSMPLNVQLILILISKGKG
jgi:hypothetical protein